VRERPRPGPRREAPTGSGRHFVIRYARHAAVVALFIVAATLGVVSGVLFAYAGDLPEISALDNYAPNTITRVVAADGQLVGEFATERRLQIGYDDMAPYLRQAIIAAEDGDFDRHFGLSVPSIAIRLMRDLWQAVEDKMASRPLQRPAGASTLTQQLARNLFPQTVGFKTGDLNLERKIKEAIVAVQIEKRYTKREILTFYANQMGLGHGTYGVEAASRLYFGKSARNITLEEAALLAGIFQSPARQSPFVNVNAATGRRNYALQRMADEGFITQGEADQAKKTPVVVREQPPQLQGRSIAPYFLEEVRKHLESKYGAKQLYESGLIVKTTLDMKLQEAANRAVANGLRQLDKRRGYRGPTRNVASAGRTVNDFKDDRWNRPMKAGDVVAAVVASTGKPAPPGAARLRIGRYHADLTRDGLMSGGRFWTRRQTPAELFKAGDLIEVEIKKIDDATSTMTVSLEQTPIVEGALLAIDNRTGEIRAMVGGWDFARSKFNRAVQAYRQLGSTFKPIVYTTAIDRGYTPATVLIDAPVAFPDGLGNIYSPQNYDHKFEGPTTVRRALEQSRNIPAIKMMDMLGPRNVLAYAKRFGFEGEFGPYLPIALGAGDGTLLEVTSAYTVFPNGGVRMKPFEVLNVKDRDGNLLEENRPEASDVIRADTAFVMLNLLRGVVQRGTAATAVAAAKLDWPLGGKTGTVDENTDAWFVGFDPDLTVGVWTGLDEKKSIGANETGAQAALPIWVEFMRAYIDGRADKDTTPQFDTPGNIVFVPIDRATGTVVEPESPGAITEAFIAGTQPGGLLR
jgi:penicillin-binding protein 1A